MLRWHITKSCIDWVSGDGRYHPRIFVALGSVDRCGQNVNPGGLSILDFGVFTVVSGGLLGYRDLIIGVDQFLGCLVIR